MRDAVAEIPEVSSDLESLEVVNRSQKSVTDMLIREQVRASASSILIFEIVGVNDPVLKGFAVPLREDSSTITARRQRALLAEPVRQALLGLTSVQFEALWRLLVEQIGGRGFALKGRSGDGGIDFVGEFNVYRLSETLTHAAQEWRSTTESRSTISVIGQAKHTPNKTLMPAILRELAGTMYLHHPDTSKGERKGTTGMLVTTGRFSANAEAQARAAGIILLDGEWVLSAIINFGLGIESDDGDLRFNETGFVCAVDGAAATA